MKKLSLLLVVLLAAGSAGLYGQMAIGTNFSISGNATATAGYDIDDEQFGFKNDSNSTIKIEFVAKQSTNNAEKVDMSGGWYGSIELKDFQIRIDSDEEDSDPYVKAHKAGRAGQLRRRPDDVVQEGRLYHLACWVRGTSEGTSARSWL